MVTRTNVLWVHEEDVPWLLTYISDEYISGELAAGRRLVPIDDADGAMDDDQGLILDGAAAAAHRKDHLVTPVNARSLVGTIRWDWDLVGAWTAVITQGPRKGTTVSCEVESITAERWELVSRVYKYTVDFKTATFQDKKTVGRHFLELHLQGLHTHFEVV